MWSGSYSSPHPPSKKDIHFLFFQTGTSLEPFRPYLVTECSTLFIFRWFDANHKHEFWKFWAISSSVQWLSTTPSWSSEDRHRQLGLWLCNFTHHKLPHRQFNGLSVSVTGPPSDTEIYWNPRKATAAISYLEGISSLPASLVNSWVQPEGASGLHQWFRSRPRGIPRSSLALKHLQDVTRSCWNKPELTSSNI